MSWYGKCWLWWFTVRRVEVLKLSGIFQQARVISIKGCRSGEFCDLKEQFIYKKRAWTDWRSCTAFSAGSARGPTIMKSEKWFAYCRNSHTTPPGVLCNLLKRWRNYDMWTRFIALISKAGIFYVKQCRFIRIRTIYHKTFTKNGGMVVHTWWFALSL